MAFPRQTHTYAALEVSDVAYQEIAGKLRDACYDHAFHEDGLINMHGIALAPQTGEASSGPADEIAKLLIPEVFAEIARLQGEVEGLKILLAAQPLEAGEGIFTINMAGTPTAEQFAYLLNLWNEKWQQQGQTPPGLFPLVDGVTLESLWLSMARFYAARTTMPAVNQRCIWSAPGDASNAWCLARSLRMRSRTRSPRCQNCLRCCR